MLIKHYIKGKMVGKTVWLEINQNVIDSEF